MDKKQSRIIIITVCLIIGIVLVAGSIFFLNSRDAALDSTDTAIEQTDTPPYNFDYSWTKHPYIAHALGGIMGDVYTNSYEAFLLNYQLGQRVFEVDFLMTDDGETVALHDAEQWHNSIQQNPDDALTSGNFLSALFNQKYHTIDYRTVVDLMITHPDIYLVTDSKYTDKSHVTAEFTQIIDYAKSKDVSVLDRFVVQIYHPEMLEWVMELYPWKSVIYTLYQDPNWTPENVVQFAEQSGIKVITISGYELLDQPATAKLWNEANLIIAAFTMNNLNQVRTLWQDYGVQIIYTDFLLPDTKY